MQVIEKYGAVGGNRTRDLLITNQCNDVGKSRLAGRIYYLRLPIVRQFNQVVGKANYGASPICHCGQNPGGLCGECWLSENQRMHQHPIAEPLPRKAFVVQRQHGAALWLHPL